LDVDSDTGELLDEQGDTGGREKQAQTARVKVPRQSGTRGYAKLQSDELLRLKNALGIDDADEQEDQESDDEGDEYEEVKDKEEKVKNAGWSEEDEDEEEQVAKGAGAGRVDVAKVEAEQGQGDAWPSDSSVAGDLGSVGDEGGAGAGVEVEMSSVTDLVALLEPGPAQPHQEQTGGAGAGPVTASPAAGDAAGDLGALLALRRTVAGLARLPGWKDLETHSKLGKCKGITIDEGGRVTRVGLRSKGLSGTLPVEVGQLTALEHFSVYDNQLSGMCVLVPVVAPDIPAVAFFFLKTDLIRAFYAGALPSFATCIALTNFQCYNNQFTGA
jgi:hypothetical protein